MDQVTGDLQKLEDLAGSLKGFNFDFRKSHALSDQEITEILPTIIGQKCKKLKHLGLDFEGCENLSNKSLEKIGDQIRNILEGLVSLRLNFQSCFKLANRV